MRDDSQATTSIWMATANTPSPSPLKECIRTDICIIGAGIAGLTTAFLLGRDIKSESELKPGEGAIMPEGVSKVGVYRDEAGAVHKLSATCPHLGCVVAWNSTEKTWDCPCHGSRFSANGHVYQGPLAVTYLKLNKVRVIRG